MPVRQGDQLPQDGRISVDREKLNGNETAATEGAENSLDAGTGEQINLSDFMITGRELLSRRGSEKSRREDEVRQDLVHQRLFFYSIETFSKNKSGPIAEFSYLTADEDLKELEGRCRHHLKLRVDNIPKAQALLECIADPKAIKVQDDCIYLFDLLDKSDKVNRLLVRHGIKVSELSVQTASLEEYFLERMGK